MVTGRRQRFLHAQLAWMCAALVALAALGALSLQLYAVTSVLGLLVVVELTAPLRLAPAWRRRLRWLVLLGVLVVGAVVVWRLLAILPPGVGP